MEIYLDKLDNVTQIKYQEFNEKVKELLELYKKKDIEKYNLVKEKIEQTKGNWDTTINLVNKNFVDIVDISKLLAYEYCLAGERITNHKVSFKEMLDKLFNGVEKFRIGNPISGRDDECLYGKSFDDINAIPVTSKLYRIVMNAGAQHLDYFKDGKFTSAVFIYEKGIIKGIAKDENGNLLDMNTDGIDFSNLTKGQSLLTNLRQTVFHEWNHNSEKEIVDIKAHNIDYEYKGEDGKIYRNYEKINNYVTAENIQKIKEPQYIISRQKDSQGNIKKYFQDKRGDLRPLDELGFGLEKKQLETEYCFSSGLTTREVLPDGQTRMHNIITEGFVEKTAREMIRAVDPQVKDIDEEKYAVYVELAKKVIESRDASLGQEGQGQTYADFLMHSSILKNDLESRIVELDDGSKVDGLHYIANYANKVQNGQTRKQKFYRNLPNIIEKLNLSKVQIDALRQSKLWQKKEFNEEEKISLSSILVGKNYNNQDFVNEVVADFVDILKEETEFLNKIAEKLRYTEKSFEKQKSIQGLVQESISGLTDLTILDDIEQIQEIQQRMIIKKKEEKNDLRSIGE